MFLLNKWYFDELFHWAVVRPANLLGRLLWKGGDGAVIDGLGPNGIASTTRMVARQASRVVAIDQPTDEQLTTLVAADIAEPGEGPRHGNAS